MKTLVPLLTTLTAMFTFSTMNAQILVEYGFDANSTVYDPTISDPNIQGSVFDFGSSVNAANMDTTSALSESGRALYSDNASFYTTNEADAIAAPDYLSVTLTVESGFQADLESLEFFTLRHSAAGAIAAGTAQNGLGAPTAFSVYSSLDGFTGQLGAGVLSLADDNTFSLQSVDLSGLSSITGATEIRIFMWAGDGIGGSSERSFRMDELSISGTTAAVPEPSAFALLAGFIAIGCILKRRRSRS